MPNHTNLRSVVAAPLAISQSYWEFWGYTKAFHRDQPQLAGEAKLSPCQNDTSCHHAARANWPIFRSAILKRGRKWQFLGLGVWNGVWNGDAASIGKRGAVGLWKTSCLPVSIPPRSGARTVATVFAAAHVRRFPCPARTQTVPLPPLPHTRSATFLPLPTCCVIIEPSRIGSDPFFICSPETVTSCPRRPAGPPPARLWFAIRGRR